MSLLFIKAMQVALFYFLAKRRVGTHALRGKTAIIFGLATAIPLSCLALLFVGVHGPNENMSGIIVWIAIGLLVIQIALFLLYEMFGHEETRYYEMATRLQRLELESHHFKELETVYTDIRTWKHEYKNNLLALNALIENNEYDKALAYIGGMGVLGHSCDGIILQTGNYVLDAVVSSKLGLARSRGIDVSVQAVYPENNNIDDNDLCAIAGNLLDNSIEACLRMGGEKQDRFIVFSLLTKGKNLTLSIGNSYEGVLKKDGDRYLTAKDRQFHGIGIQYVNSIVDRLQGHIMRECADGVFETHVMLPLIAVEGGGASKKTRSVK
jgi:hypothetical protein